MLKELSHVYITTIPLKVSSDAESNKPSQEIDKDAHTAIKIAERHNYQTLKNKRLSLCDRFEMIASGFELKSKHTTGVADREIFIYRKDKKTGSNQYQSASQTQSFDSYGSHRNVLPAARGFFSHQHENSLDSGVSSSGSLSPTKSPSYTDNRFNKSKFSSSPRSFSQRRSDHSDRRPNRFSSRAQQNIFGDQAPNIV